MTDMMFDQQHGPRIGFGEATVNARTSTIRATLLLKPSSRAQLVCQWHRSAQGPLTCMWTEARSTLLGVRDVRLPDLAREDHFTCESRPESRLQSVSRWIAMTVLLTSAALGTFMCFVTEPSDLL